MMTIFTVRHASLLPVAAIRLQMSVPSAYAPTQEVSVSTPPFVERTFRHMIRCPHRGVYEAGVTRISVMDIFGMFCFYRKPHTRLFRMEVLPKVRDLSLIHISFNLTMPSVLMYALMRSAMGAVKEAMVSGVRNMASMLL